MSETKRVHIEMAPFITAWEQSESIKEVADKLGIKATSVMARASKYRGEPLNIPLKQMARSGGAKLNIDSAKELIAQLRGKTLDDVNVEVTTLKAKHEAKIARAEAKVEMPAENTGETS